ncbi:hypothetical protein, partial [Methylobacterium frigidaeris]
MTVATFDGNVPEHLRFIMISLIYIITKENRGMVEPEDFLLLAMGSDNIIDLIAKENRLNFGGAFKRIQRELDRINNLETPSI